jgi:peptidoglycan lytic transglycosylase G
MPAKESHHTIRDGNQKNLQVKWELRRLLLLAVIAALLCAGLVIYSPAGPHSEMFLEIPPGTSSAKIADLLKLHGLIWSRYAFDAMRLVRGGTLKAGEYRFDHPARLSEVYARLEKGDVYTRTLTIPEGANMFDIAQRVETAQLGSKEAFLDAVKRNATLISDLDPEAQSVEGYLFPDTYQFQRETGPDQMIAAMVKRFRQSATSIDLTQNYHNIVTMASLVERETPIGGERPVVASVFFNRIAKGMPLMTDPSVIYADLLDGKYRGTIYQSDLVDDSPYNTYKHVGLPPGPICNPGIESLKAAMTPTHTQYLYFVAASTDPSGHSRFAKTLEEHQQNVQAYRRAQRSAGER